jgi:signal transduction histidine kinase
MKVALVAAAMILISGSGLRDAVAQAGLSHAAPPGHRQPKANDIPQQGQELSEADKKLKELDAALAKKLQGICRGVSEQMHRPLHLIAKLAELGSEDPALAPLYEDAIRDTIERFEAAGSPVVTDGEQRKYHNFLTYCVHGLRQLEADLARMNRVSIMGELAASLAHEIKQPMAAAVLNARTCARWLRRDVPDLSEAADAASKMVDDVTRAAAIIDRVRSLYRRDAPQSESVDLNEVVREMASLLGEAGARSSVSIRTELDPGLPPITADRVQLQQVLMNLMLNGIEAMRDRGGELTVTSGRTEDGEFLISVRDCGVGFSPHENERIFETFFTTKPQGTGMGLSISRRIIETHGGRLWASANVPRGAIFQFTVPAPQDGS